MVQMDRDAVEVIGRERAGLAALLPIGAEHEVIDDKLRAPVEGIGEGEGAIRPLETVGFIDAFPRHRHAAAHQRVALAREFLLGDQQCETGPAW